MKDSEHDELLREVLGCDGELPAFRAASLEQALQWQRRRRRLRRGAGVCVLACLALALGLGAIMDHRHPIHSPIAAVPNTSGDAPPAKTRIITDEELFALFPGHAVALIGKPGYQRFVVLEAPRTDAPAAGEDFAQ